MKKVTIIYKGKFRSIICNKETADLFDPEKQNIYNTVIQDANHDEINCPQTFVNVILTGFLPTISSWREIEKFKGWKEKFSRFEEWVKNPNKKEEFSFPQAESERIRELSLKEKDEITLQELHTKGFFDQKNVGESAYLILKRKISNVGNLRNLKTHEFKKIRQFGKKKLRFTIALLNALDLKIAQG